MPDSLETDPLAEAYNRGLALEKSGDFAGAEIAYREALALDPADHGGVSIRLAAMGRADAPAHAPDAYVATLFDQNAAQFDDMLVEQLGYAVPMLVRERLEALAPGPYPRLLDLGCGTGLTGVSLNDWCPHITGVDLSAGMLDEAYERGVYDDLYVAEAVEFLEETDDPPWDMITATDVLPYIGRLGRFFAGGAATAGIGRPAGGLLRDRGRHERRLQGRLETPVRALAPVYRSVDPGDRPGIAGFPVHYRAVRRRPACSRIPGDLPGGIGHRAEAPFSPRCCGAGPNRWTRGSSRSRRLTSGRSFRPCYQWLRSVPHANHGRSGWNTPTHPADVGSGDVLR